jgi:hypothetical protein
MRSARWIALLLVALTTTPSLAQGSPEDRIKALEADNQRLQRELQAANKRLQELEAGKAAPATAARATEDPGPDNFGNPLAARRTLGQMLREHLASRNVQIPDGSSDARAVATYRAEVERWFRDPLRQRRLRQPISWNIEILDVGIASNSSVREYDIDAYSLNADGARVGRWYTIRCPASAVPKLNPLDAKGLWSLKGDLIPEITLAPEGAQPTGQAFRGRDTIAPQVECGFRFSVSSLERTGTATPAPATR